MIRFKPGMFYFLLILIASLTNCKNYKLDMVVELNSGWTFRNAADSVWHPATVPGTVHTDLLQNGFIEDPYYRTNELDQQYIDKEDWVYSLTFNGSEELLTKEHVDITFYGLDTSFPMTFVSNGVYTLTIDPT